MVERIKAGPSATSPRHGDRQGVSISGMIGDAFYSDKRINQIYWPAPKGSPTPLLSAADASWHYQAGWRCERLRSAEYLHLNELTAAINGFNNLRFSETKLSGHLSPVFLTSSSLVCLKLSTFCNATYP